MKAKFFAGLAAATVMAAGSAQALTTISSPNATSGGSVVATNYGVGANLTFEWGTSLPFSGYVTVTSDTDFSLYFTEFSGTGNQVTGYVLIEQGSPSVRYTDNYAWCTSASAAIAGSCDLLSNGTTTSLAITEPDTVTAAYDLGAGTYLLGVYEGNDTNGFASFQVSEIGYQEEFILSAVPLPAGGMLLLGALGGIAALRRRRKAA